MPEPLKNLLHEALVSDMADRIVKATRRLSIKAAS